MIGPKANAMMNEPKRDALKSRKPSEKIMPMIIAVISHEMRTTKNGIFESFLLKITHSASYGAKPISLFIYTAALTAIPIIASAKIAIFKGR